MPNTDVLQIEFYLKLFSVFLEILYPLKPILNGKHPSVKIGYVMRHINLINLPHLDDSNRGPIQIVYNRLSLAFDCILGHLYSICSIFYWHF